MKTMTATDALDSLYELVEQVNKNNEIFEIIHGADEVVMMSHEHYEGLQETLHLLSQSGFKSGFDQSVEEADQGRTDSFEHVFG
ncbi:MAG: type II toxin-antitoxin system Phd/YefM family antitoxin [Pseudomonadota bacterium]|nr:type II toxin-antitoxin system Phd/YefM family antitoxin [Pseudomonadota bacterium]MEC8483872.1 type II toxin-antitoxin system Phd/YefM family antitoxin [Pseudomonadota bacterium]